MLSPHEVGFYFNFKAFPKGLASIGQVVVEALSDDGHVGDDFGEIKNPYGPEWKVYWADGQTEMIEQPKKNLALSLQAGQEVMVDGKLMQCTHYDSKGCHLTLSSGGADPDSVPTTEQNKRKTRSAKAAKGSAADPVENGQKNKRNLRSAKAAKGSAADTVVAGQKKKLTTKVVQPKKRTRSSTAKPKATAKEKATPPVAEEVAVAAACALTAKAKDGETIDQAHLRIGAGLAAVSQVKEVVQSQKAEAAKWKRCRRKKISDAQRSVLSKVFSAAKCEDKVSFVFAERTMMEYASMQKSPTHMNAKNVFTGAIGQVMRQVVPPTDQPCGGDVPKVFDLLFPISEAVSKIYHC